MLKLFPIRLEEYQIIELKNRLPDRQISTKIRELVAIYIDIQDTTEDRLIELNDKVDSLDKQKKIILNEIESIKQTKDKIMKENELNSFREKYLISNQNTIQMYKNKNITAKGFKVLMKRLSFDSKDDLISFLESQVNE